MGILFSQGDASYFLRLDLKLILSLLALNSLFFFFSGTAFYVASRGSGQSIPFYVCFALQLVGSFLNWILPARGGVLYRSRYLQVHHQMEFKKFTSVSIFLSFIGLLVICMVGAPSVLFLSLKRVIIGKFLSFLFSALGLMVLLLLIFNRKVARISDLLKIDLGVGSMLFVMLSYLLALGSFSWILKLLMAFFFVDASWIQSLGIASFIMLINTVPLLPGNMGVREFAYTFIFKLLGQPIELGLFMALIDRLVQVVFLGITGPIFSWKMDILKLKGDEE